MAFCHVHGTYKKRQKRKEELKEKEIRTVPSEIRNAQLTGCTRPSGFWKVQRQIRAGSLHMGKGSAFRSFWELRLPPQGR